MSHRGRVEPRRTVQGLHVNFLPSTETISILFFFHSLPPSVRFPFVDSSLTTMYRQIYGERPSSNHPLSTNIYIYICIVEKTIESFEALDKRGEHIGNKSLGGLYHETRHNRISITPNAPITFFFFSLSLPPE